MTGRPDTLLAHVGAPDFLDGAAPVNVPVVRTSTVRFETTGDFADLTRRRAAGERVATYGRQGLQTHHALEDVLLALEGGHQAFLAPSGLCAITLTLLSTLSAGDHALVTDGVYSPVRRVEQALLQRMGISVTYFSAAQDDVESLIRPNTKLLYLESPTSLLYEILDLPALTGIAHRHGLVVATDNTWGAGYLYRPLELGANISVQAATKYLGGHSDVMLGAVVVADAELGAKVTTTYETLGLSVGADDAYLALRGARTLGVRLDRHGSNALAVARFLHVHKDVARVFFPALESDPGHTLWQRDFSGVNGLLSFELKGRTETEANRLLDALEYFALGASWGGYESLAQMAATVRLDEHSFWDGKGPVIRLHVGLEDERDLIDDLSRAFDAMDDNERGDC